MCTGIDLDCCSILTSQMKQYLIMQKKTKIIYRIFFFSLRYLNLGWTQLNDQCVHYICRTIQPTIEQLTLTGFRQGMTDDCKTFFDNLNLRKSFFV